MVRIHDGYTIAREPIALTVAIIGIVFSLFYLFSKIGVLQSAFYTTDTVFAWLFAIYTFLACMILSYKVTKRRVS